MDQPAQPENPARSRYRCEHPAVRFFVPSLRPRPSGHSTRRRIRFDGRHGQRLAADQRLVGHFRRAIRQPEQRSRRRGGIPQPRRLPPARVDLVRQRIAAREVRIRRRVLLAATTQHRRRHAPDVSIRHARRHLSDDGADQLRQHEPLFPDRPDEPVAPARAHARHDQHGHRRHRVQGEIQRPVLAGSVDAEAIHGQRRSPLRPCDEQLPRNVHRSGPVHPSTERRFVCRLGSLLHAADRWRLLQRRHPAVGRVLGRVRHRQDVGEVEHGQVSLRRGDQRHLRRREPCAASGQRSHAQLDRHQRQSSRRLQPAELRRQW